MQESEIKAICEKAEKDLEDENFELVLEALGIVNKHQTNTNSPTLNTQKRELNRSLTYFAKSSWRNIDQYRSSLSRLAPEARAGPFVEDGLSKSDLTKRTVLFFNLAVINYHSGQYKTSLRFLAKLSDAKFPSEKLRVQSFFLEIEIHLLLQQTDKALKLCEVVEKSLKNGQMKGTVEGAEMLERLHTYRLRAALIMKQLNKYAALAVKDTNWKLSALTGRYKCLSLGQGSEDCWTLVEYVKEVYPTSGTWKNGGGAVGVLRNNSTGCVYGKFGKPQLAVLHFSKTVAEIRNLEGERSLFTCPAPWKLCVQYNLGVSLLKAGKPQAAFDCFISVVQHYHSNSRLWLRLAECCVAAHHNHNPKDKEIVRDVIGIGPHRKAVLNSALGNSTIVECQGGMGAIPMPSLEFAGLCLKNVLTLLPNISREALEKDMEGEAPDPSLFPAPPGPPLSLKEVHRIRCSSLCCAAYVSLCVGETQMALEYAYRLSRLPFLSHTHEALWRLYKAEAYILLEDYSLAIELLDPTKLDDISSVKNFWTFKSPSADNLFGLPDLRSVIIYNLSLSCAMEGNYRKSGEVIAKIKLDGRTPPEVLMLVLFLQIKIGKLDMARKMVLDQIPSLRS